MICFQLHSHSEPTIGNTAAATLRQLVAVVFDRVVQETNSPGKYNLFI